MSADAEAPIFRLLNPDTLTALEATFANLEQAAVAEVEADGIPQGQIELPLRFLDLRYLGVESTLTIARPADGDYQADYELLHEQMFGYRRNERPIEIVAARVEVVGRVSQDDTSEQPTTYRRPDPAATASVFLDSEMRLTDIYHRRDLQPGDELIGPAILCEPTSTVVVDFGFTATVTGAGSVLLFDRKAGHVNPLTRSANTGI